MSESDGRSCPLQTSPCSIDMSILFGDGPRINDSIFQSGDAEVDAEEAIFVELIQTLLKDPAERKHFYQARPLHTKQPILLFFYLIVYLTLHCCISEYLSPLSFSGGFSSRIWSQLRHRHAAACVGVSFQTGETSASTRPRSGGERHTISRAGQ